MVYGQRYERLKALLRKARQDAQLTQTQLADRLSKRQAYVSKIELGERHLSFMDFLEWCEACNADPAEIVRQV
ncbi:helix-turn-helix domain-containing protein [Burkholderia cenocepacia]|uniref:helix-turn-helix domain-containing protein n=1 Tax=Burkholderia cenocepacia TaxID=95486 RepID=UPI001B94A84A|nr:helix-turn-helix transcriptional regulator [Burkholderia cenocepacia]MBR7907401.1 helix-turn-helix transcriptional regulator [Burkholderia cenocepacia]MBR8426602.1 helix-turn-helix transcriptional regulator [Burkholderia cenocepacia]